MDCNREEAVRARGIAEKRLEAKDFAGARKFGVKAQQLYPDLENISRLLMVCEVHCSAEQLVGGNDKDWYGILKVDHKADEQTIKKQFKKFALQLHPDKNKFSGAEAAFQLISEAQNVLLDRDRRSLHDIKRRTAVSKTNVQYRPPAKASYYQTVKTTMPAPRMNHQQQQQQQQQQQLPTFWTLCPFCHTKYQYYRASALHKPLTCQSCKKLYVAYETNTQAPPTTVNQQAYPQQKPGFSKVETKRQENCTAEKPNSETVRKSGPQAGGSSGSGSEKVSRKRDRKRDRKRVVDSESSDSESSSDSEEDLPVDMEGVHPGFYGEHPRRSSRGKQKVSYNENVSDDDDIPVSKRGKIGPSCATEELNKDASKEEPKMNSDSKPVADTKVDEEKVIQKQSSSLENSSNVQEAQKMVNGERSSQNNVNVQKSSTSNTSSEEEIAEVVYSVPHSDFSDFDSIRTEECFKVGQLWAAYDTQNGMPRFYARIKKLYSSEFKVQVTWLEAEPNDDDGQKWLNANLPISCGKFTHGQSETIKGFGVFSHVICWEKIKNMYKIYPRKGETWAIFKNWEMNWCSDMDSNCKREFEYDYVEILSEYDQHVGFYVALLEKVEGFVSVFRQMVQEGKCRLHVLPGELLRFSHRLPSFKLTGDEGAGVPPGSVELDPASMLFSAEEIEAIEKNGHSRTNGLCSKSSDMRESMTGNVATQGANLNINNLEQTKPSQDYDADENIDVPEPVFYNFDADKLLEKFEIGQIWALYCDEDGLPKYYGQIKSIVSRRSRLKIMVAWLESSSLPGDVLEWHDQGMPISCGRFKIIRQGGQEYDSTMSFSHLVKAVPVSRTDVEILPKKGEVWALYKNWTRDISTSGLANCDYDIVEVCEVTGLQRKVLILGRVDGFDSVFKVEVKGGLPETMTIPEAELLRFSHIMPSFRLTEERGGSLRGCWELDPAAFPVQYFGKS